VKNKNDGSEKRSVLEHMRYWSGDVSRKMLVEGEEELVKDGDGDADDKFIEQDAERAFKAGFRYGKKGDIGYEAALAAFKKASKK
jgi:hypothetical protein